MNKNTLTTVLGGTTLQVAFLDGKTESLLVRQLPFSDMPRYMGCFEDEMASVELFCEKPAGWAETLTRESFEMVMTEGEKLNLDFLERYAARAAARRERVNPGQQEKLMSAAMSKIMPAVLERLDTSLPRSAPKAG
jgi:hypothetical protein